MPRRRLRRVRRPLIALIALVLALAVGYGVRAAHDSGHAHNRPSPTVTVSR